QECGREGTDQTRRRIPRHASRARFQGRAREVASLDLRVVSQGETERVHYDGVRTQMGKAAGACAPDVVGLEAVHGARVRKAHASDRSSSRSPAARSTPTMESTDDTVDLLSR